MTVRGSTGRNTSSICLSGTLLTTGGGGGRRDAHARGGSHIDTYGGRVKGGTAVDALRVM